MCLLNKPYVIAEIGINHNGSLDMAKLLIDLAKMNRADAVKFQKRTPELCVPKDQWNILRDTPFGPGPLKYIDYKRKIEFGKKEFDEIDGYCNIKDINWFASVWDKESMKFISNYDVPFIKIPSACLTDIELLNEIKEYDYPIIISTGMSTKKHIDYAVKILNHKIHCIMHCVSSYPTPDNEMNMYKIKHLKEEYPDYMIGFSNHSMKLIYIAQAYIMGAEFLEFHITIDRSMKGTDHKASIGPRGFEKIMRYLDSIYKAWGDGVFNVMDSEKPIIKKLRKYK